MAKDGQFLSEDEVKEYLAYVDQGLAPPDKFNDVVFDGTMINRAGYRWKTADERKAGEAAAEDAAAASREVERLQAKAREEAAKRGSTVPVVGARVPAATGEGA